MSRSVAPSRRRGKRVEAPPSHAYRTTTYCGGKRISAEQAEPAEVGASVQPSGVWTRISSLALASRRSFVRTTTIDSQTFFRSLVSPAAFSFISSFVPPAHPLNLHTQHLVSFIVNSFLDPMSFSLVALYRLRIVYQILASHHFLLRANRAAKFEPARPGGSSFAPRPYRLTPIFPQPTELSVRNAGHAQMRLDCANHKRKSAS